MIGEDVGEECHSWEGAMGQTSQVQRDRESKMFK